MASLRLRTQLLIANLLIVCGLTGAILFIVRSQVRSEIDQQVRDSTAASVRAFTSVQKQRELQLSRTAALLAELPTLKAMMTTEHAPTIQDASLPFWRLAGSDLFLIANPAGQILGFHVRRDVWNPATAEPDLKRSLEQGEDAAWWYAAGQLYWVFLRPITAGTETETKQLGVIAVGEQVDSSVAQQLAVGAGSQIVLASGNNIIASTFPASEEPELQALFGAADDDDANSTREVSLRSNQYDVTSVLIHDGPPTPVRCYVLVSLGPANKSIQQLNRTIFILGLSAVLFGALLLTFVSRTITRPLDNLVAGVRALATGDYAYAITTPTGSSEVAEVGDAFAKMRSELLASQQRWIANERTAALGRAASSISHDLRHHLAALVANAEFLYEAEKLKLDRNEVYNEIKAASEQMLDLLDSLRELSREDGAISPVPASLEQAVRHAVEAVLTRPEFRSRTISVHATGETDGVFDPKKIERAFFNLILNSCEATAQWQGHIEVEISSRQDSFDVRVVDNGAGIPSGIRATLFDPFVSLGKPNGTGLGLAIVNKIVHDHAGSVVVEKTSESGTVFLVRLPRLAPVANPTPQTAVT
ncbi:MAG TPA: HAMP domain-containing sensor histidine kinase [Candidatus Acidoferrales bacterium]|nr:HAMP domain-containing sensor histidine kinase [Candidatus Acidoferrales bacterium]